LTDVVSEYQPDFSILHAALENDALLIAISDNSIMLFNAGNLPEPSASMVFDSPISSVALSDLD